MLRSHGRVLGLVAATLFVLSACTTQQDVEPDTSPDDGQPTNSEAASGEPVTITVALPGFHAESTAKWLGSQGMLNYIGPMYDPLIAADTEGQLTGDGIITDWQFNADGDEVTLSVREGVRFHNGDELTAEDVQFTLEVYTTPGLPLSVGGALRESVESVEVDGPSTVRVQLSSPNAIFPNLLGWIEGDVGVIPKAYIESLPGDTFEEKTEAFVEAPIGTGPFRFVSREVGSSITFEANPDYFRPDLVPQFDSLVLLNVAEIGTRMSMVETGQIDIAELPADQAAEAVDLDLDVYISRNVAHAGLMFIRSYDPSFITNDVRVRQALILAVDREALVSSLFVEIPEVGPTATVSRGPFLTGPGVAGYRDDLPSYPYDPDEARRLLQEAGYDGETIVAWSFSFSALPVAQRMLEAITEYWKAVGINVEIRGTEGATIFERLGASDQPFDSNDVDMAAANYRPSALTNLSVFATSHEYGFLMQSHIPEEFDRILLEARAIADPDDFDTYMADVWNDLVDEYWALPLAWVNKTIVANPATVAGYTPQHLTSDLSGWENVIPAR